MTTPIIKKKHVKTKKPISNSSITFANTKEKGDAYEIFIKHHLIDSGNYKSVYLWKDIPEADLFSCGIMDDWNTARMRRKQALVAGLLPDFGTDLLVQSSSGMETGGYSIVQCKNYEKPVCANDLGTFLCMVMRYHANVSSIVYSNNGFETYLPILTKGYGITFNHVKFDESKYLELMNTIYKPVINEDSILVPYDYQDAAILALRGKHRAVCQIPCGCGKTLISIKLCMDYNHCVVVTPLKAYCEQNMERYKSQMPGYGMLVIDSDNNGRDIDTISSFIKKNKKVCLFVTFKSVDIVNALVANGILEADKYFVVIDEFHNLSINDVLAEEDDFDVLEADVETEDMLEADLNLDDNESGEEDDLEDELEDEEHEEVVEEKKESTMYTLLHSNVRILFLSATPKLYGSNAEFVEDCDIDIDETIFGNVEYKLDMGEAIAEGKICDYMIYVPTLSIEKSVGLDKIQEEMDIRSYDQELVIKARFLIRGMMNNGSRKCIIYMQTKDECRKMQTILEDLAKNYFAIESKSWYIVSDCDRKERHAVLKASLYSRERI
jgi:predicted helicase